MKLPDEIVGYIDYEDESYIFKFENNKLNLYSKNIDQWFKKAFKEQDVYVNEFIPYVNIEGRCSDGNKIIFNIKKKYIVHNGFFSFSVLYFVYYDEERFNKDEIKKISLNSDIINYFFPPYNAYRSGEKITDIKVEDINKINDCSFKFKGKDIFLSIIINFKRSFLEKFPITLNSKITLEFDNLSIEEIFKLQQGFVSFFNYLTFRKNNYIDYIELFSEGRVSYGTMYLVKNEGMIEEKNKKQLKRKIITYSLIKDCYGELLNKIFEDEIYLNHLNSSIKSTKEYNISRYLLDFAAFESEFRSIYGKDYRKNEIYLKVKEYVVNFMDNCMKNANSKEKKYLRSIKFSIEHLDNNYERRIELAYEDCEDILKYFYEKIRINIDYKEFAQEMNTYRNLAVHANNDFKIEAKYLSYFVFLEIMLYVIRLKNIGMDKENIVESIKCLFSII